MTSMVENMSELLVGSYVVLIPCLTRPGIARRSRTWSVPTRVASARPCVSNKKSAWRAWQLCQALDDYSLSLPKHAFNRSASNLDRSENQVIAHDPNERAQAVTIGAHHRLRSCIDGEVLEVSMPVRVSSSVDG